MSDHRRKNTHNGREYDSPDDESDEDRRFRFRDPHEHRFPGDDEPVRDPNVGRSGCYVIVAVLILMALLTVLVVYLGLR